jgi:acetyl-CoA carboxylase biotin carboxyl carrier protein
MDFKQIQELIKMINNTDIGEVTIEQKDFRVTIKQKEQNITQVVSSAPMPQMMQQQPVQQQTPPAPPSSSASGETTGTQPPKGDENFVTIKSPMIGTFYRRPGPDKPNFLEVGDDVTPGKVVCIIEAMKLFNEIESEVKGKVVKLLVDDASPVEYDQPLYLVDPT